METWHFGAPNGSGSLSLPSVALLLEAAASERPAHGWLQFVDVTAPVDYLSLVEYVRPPGEDFVAPELVEGLAAPDLPNVTPDCFAMYRQRFWRADEATRLAQRPRSATDSMTALRFRPIDITDPSWRREIYERVQLEDRLSFLYTPAPGMVCAMNLYRTKRNGPFRPGEIVRLLEVAPLIQLAHRTALAGTARRRDHLMERLARAERGLGRHVPELSERERAVCARIACGLSADGIAADLDVAPSTVVTMRKRAYAKMAARGMPTGRVQLARLAE